MFVIYGKLKMVFNYYYCIDYNRIDTTWKGLRHLCINIEHSYQISRVDLIKYWTSSRHPTEFTAVIIIITIAFSFTSDVSYSSDSP